MLNRNSEVFYVLKHKHLCSIKASTNLRFSIQLDAHDPDKNRRVKRLLRGLGYQLCFRHWSNHVFRKDCAELPSPFG